MKKVNKNLISEINRINELLGTKAIITEATVNPIIDLARAIIKVGTRSSSVRTLQQQLAKATTDTKRIEIINKLRNSTDQTIQSLIKSADTKIILDIAKRIPTITRNPVTIKSINNLIQKGLSKDEIVDLVTQKFKNNFGVYADDLVDDFVNDLRVAYDEITTPNVVDDVTPVVDDIPNVSQEISEIAPEITRQVNLFLDQNDELANEIVENIERLNNGGLQGQQITELETTIKRGLDSLRARNKNLVDNIFKEINQGINSLRNTPEQRRNFSNILKRLEEIKKAEGDWGVTEIGTPNSSKWLPFKEAWRYAFAFEKNIAIGVRNLFRRNRLLQALEEFRKILDIKNGAEEAQQVMEYVKSPLKKGKFFYSNIFPGSPRGLPFNLKSVEGKLLPNAYAEILTNMKRYPKYQAWFSLVLEKLIVAIKVQFYFAMINGAINFFKFKLGSDKSIMRTHGDCVREIADVMNSESITLDNVENLDYEKIPNCLLQLSTDPNNDELIAQMLIRADFVNRGDSYLAYFSYFWDELFNMTLENFGVKFLSGPLASVLTDFITKTLPILHQSDITGDETALETEIRRLQREAQSTGVIIDGEEESTDLPAL